MKKRVLGEMPIDRKRMSNPRSLPRGNLISRRQVIIIAVGILAVILLGLFGTTIGLYLNFLLGNDIVIRLGLNQEWFPLNHGENASLLIDASVATNPFCRADCSFSARELGSGRVISSEEFTLRPSLPVRREYLLEAPSAGSGIETYDFSMECRSVRTLLCQTREEPTQRRALVLLQYGPGEEEKKQLEALSAEFQQTVTFGNALLGRAFIYRNLAVELNRTLIIPEEELSLFSLRVDALENSFNALEQEWKRQNLSALNLAAADIRSIMADLAELDSSLNQSLFRFWNGYQNLRQQQRESLSLLEEMSAEYLTNSSLLALVNGSWEDYFLAEGELSGRGELEKKEELMGNLSLVLADRREFLNATVQSELQERAALLEQLNEAICLESSYCAGSAPVDGLSTMPNLEIACGRAAELWENLVLLNLTANLTNATLAELEKVQCAARRVPPGNFTLLPGIGLPGAVTPGGTSENDWPPQFGPAYSGSANFSLVLEEAEPQCCLFGQCRACCLAAECRAEPDFYPVVFLHGHAVSSETSFEYSLEGFSEIEEKLAKEGFLNAGAITLYSTRDVPEGIWGRLPAPLTLRSSYYFDLFGEPENYVVVQTKSENIDTYAVRLKEVIDTIVYRSGRPKVNLVAFSMGGLVARRYLQIFGAGEVNSLVTIGTPHLGIEGDISGYCPLTGEQRECRDMNAGSLFLNKLNRGPLPEIPIYSIVGTGCRMNGEPGDGAVLERNARLEGAVNILVNGSCPTLAEPLHLQLREVSRFPQVYEVILKAVGRDP